MNIVQLLAEKCDFDAVIVDDKPEFRWRSFMLDCAGQFWSVLASIVLPMFITNIIFSRT